MAQTIGSQVKLNNGQLITPQQGGWYDGQQYWGGTLSAPGQINTLSDQPGAGQNVSNEVIAQTNPANVAYVQKQQQQYKPPTQPTQPTQPSVSPTATTGVAGTGAGTGMGELFKTQPTLNLPDLYNTLYKSSGISTLQDQYAQMQKDYTEATGKINDNPFLSEATRVGRVAKLDKLFQDRTANTLSQIATKKADVETQLNLQTKQFDINSQAAQQALSQFNTLLGMGALNNASGDDIANLTRSTGIPSSLIYSAIDVNKKKNVNTSVIQSTADSGEVTVSVINTDTGEIVKQTSLGKVGNAQTGAKTTEAEKLTELKSQMISALESVKNSYGHVTPQDWQGALASWISRGGNAKDFIDNFKQYADPNRGDFDQVYYQR